MENSSINERTVESKLTRVKRQRRERQNDNKPTWEVVDKVRRWEWRQVIASHSHFLPLTCDVEMELITWRVRFSWQRLSRYVSDRETVSQLGATHWYKHCRSVCNALPAVWIRAAQFHPNCKAFGKWRLLRRIDGPDRRPVWPHFEAWWTENREHGWVFGRGSEPPPKMICTTAYCAK